MSTSCVLLKITQVFCIRFHLGAGTSTVTGHKSFQKDSEKQETRNSRLLRHCIQGGKSFFSGKSAREGDKPS